MNLIPLMVHLHLFQNYNFHWTDWKTIRGGDNFVLVRQPNRRTVRRTVHVRVRWRTRPIAAAATRRLRFAATEPCRDLFFLVAKAANGIPSLAMGALNGWLLIWERERKKRGNPIDKSFNRGPDTGIAVKAGSTRTVRNNVVEGVHRMLQIRSRRSQFSVYHNMVNFVVLGELDHYTSETVKRSKKKWEIRMGTWWQTFDNWLHWINSPDNEDEIVFGYLGISF